MEPAMELKDLVSKMKPKAEITQMKIKRAVHYLGQARDALDGRFPDVEATIDEALERLDVAAEELEEEVT
jgi:hypothetical protein